MKKTYISPLSAVICAMPEGQMLTGSLKLNNEEVSEGWVKENSAAARNYDVWEDDWSK